MYPPLLASYAGFCLLSPLVMAAIDPQIVGTWTSKTGKVLTGPGFYNPNKEEMLEPDLPGISYSFTEDGYYETALYRALANPSDPACPKSMIQWQHGTFTQEPNGSLLLTPFAVDGRQMTSDPCKYDSSTFIRYRQPEVIKKYEQLLDKYNDRERLNLFQWDGTPTNPLWLAYRPPQMLPTSTLNPTSGATGSPSQTGSSSKSKVKRSLGLADAGEVEEIVKPLNHKVMDDNTLLNANVWFWLGVSLTGIGSALFMFS
ncbi:MAG: Reversal of tor2 lethality [Alyxoria varia]|nr:MAG: Reversal of tor2 lethality [Alyxoria varia]